jgi:molybdenum cofactor guanylyltransferase
MTGAPEPTCCAVVLAGGQSTRMQGRNKAFLRLEGRTLLERLIATLEVLFGEIVLVTREPDLYAAQPVRIVEDLFAVRSSLTGIHAGLAHARTDCIFVVPCDTPLLQPALIRLLTAQIDLRVDAIVPFVQGFYEPLCAVYSKACLAPIEEQLERGDFKITHFFDRIRLKRIPEEQIKQVDPQLLSFRNVNTPKAYAALKELMGRH